MQGNLSHKLTQLSRKIYQNQKQPPNAIVLDLLGQAGYCCRFDEESIKDKSCLVGICKLIGDVSQDPDKVVAKISKVERELMLVEHQMCRSDSELVPQLEDINKASRWIRWHFLPSLPQRFDLDKDAQDLLSLLDRHFGAFMVGREA